jgi:hypothetical protein
MILGFIKSGHRELLATQVFNSIQDDDDNYDEDIHP